LDMHLGFPTRLRGSSEEFGVPFVVHTSEYLVRSSKFLSSSFRFAGQMAASPSLATRIIKRGV
jgi:hypothetical protein